MEQKKIVWIIFSIALVLLVAVGTALIWLRPVQEDHIASAPVQITDIDPRLEFDPVEWVRGTTERPGIERENDLEGPEANETFVIVIDEVEDGTTETRIEARPTAEDKRQVVRVPRETPVPAPAQPKVTEEVPAPTTAPQPSAEEKRPASAAPSTETRRVVEYWIQAGSYTSRFRAEESRLILNEKGFISRISTINVDGEDYYRVRLGPYPDQREAEKFLDWVKSLDPFESSYISQVYVERQVN